MNHLPLTLPLRYLGMSDAEVDQIDSVLQPQIDAAYARNDNWFTGRSPWIRCEAWIR